MVTAAGQLSTGAVMMLLLVLVSGAPWPQALPSMATWGSLLGLALFSTALAYILYFRLLQSAGPTNVLLVTLLVPVSAIVLGAVILHEAILARHLAGMGLIAAALLALDGRLVEVFSKRRVPGPGFSYGKTSRPDQEIGGRGNDRTRETTRTGLPP